MKKSGIQFLVFFLLMSCWSSISYGQSRATLAGVMARYYNYNMRIANNPTDNTKEIEQLSFLFPQYRNVNIPTNKKLVLVMVEDRLVTAGQATQINKLKKQVERYKKDLERENFTAVVIKAKVYSGSSHQDGATVLAIRKFFQEVKSRFSQMEGAVFIGSFPEATIVRQALWRRAHANDTLRIGNMRISPPWLSIQSEYFGDRTDLVMADLDGNWENIYTKAKTNVESIRMAPIASQKNNFFTNGKLVISSAGKYEKKTIEFTDFFFVKDANYSVLPSSDGKLKVKIRLAEKDVELSNDDKRQPNTIARPDICVSRINARNVALEVATRYRNQVLDAQGNPKSGPKNHGGLTGLFDQDLTLEYKLLNEYFDRNHSHRTGKTSHYAKKAAAVSSPDFRDYPDGQVSWFRPIGSSFSRAKKFKGGNLVKYIDFLKEPAVIKGVSAHSTPTSSEFGETTRNQLHTAIGPQKWYWEVDGEVYKNRFRAKNKNADFFIYRSLYENGTLRNAGPSFYYHNGCNVNSPRDPKLRYNEKVYGFGQNAESILFYANGLSIITRAKTFNDEPDINNRVFMQRWNNSNLGYALRDFQRQQANNRSNDRGSGHVIQNKRSYPWSITGDWTLKVLYPNISTEKKHTMSVKGGQPRIATGDFDNDNSKEIIIGSQTNDGRLAVMVYSDNGMRTRTGDIRLNGKAISVASGNFDNDPKDELVVATQEGENTIKVRIYDATMRGNRIQFTEKGVLSVGGKNVSVATGNFDNENKDEIVIGLTANDGRLAVLVYDVRPAGNRFNLSTRIGDYRFAGKNLQVAAGNFDRDNKDEIAMVSIDNSRKIAIMVQDVRQQGNRLDLKTRIGDQRFAGRMPSIGVGNFDRDRGDELLIGSVDNQNKSAIMVYNPKPSGNRIQLERIKDARLSGNQPVVSGNITSNGQWFLVGFGNAGKQVKLEIHDWL